jgi:aminoglycoside phosphotransferase (APT) family kinase protein
VSSFEERVPPSPEALDALLATVFPARRIVVAEALAQGLCNFNYKIVFDSGAPVVVRVYGRDPTACEKEVDLLRHVGDQVPVPEVLEAYPNGLGDIGPFLVTRFVEGITFRRLRATRDATAVAEAAGAIGETLARIGRFEFDRRGLLGAGPSVDGPFRNGPDAVPELVDECLESPVLRARLGEPTCEEVRCAVWARASDLGQLESECRLVHRDFNSRNTLVRYEGGRWRVAAVLDWEYAVSGSPLVDVGSFLRYERRANPSREPDFSRGYVNAGGQLPDGWWKLARVVDVASLCEILTEPAVPNSVVREVAELVRATADEIR